MIFAGQGVKNQFILAKTIDFSLLVQQKSSVESSINNEVHQKSTFKVHTVFTSLRAIFLFHLITF